MQEKVLKTWKPDVVSSRNINGAHFSPGASRVDLSQGGLFCQPREILLM
jgi:hypothetical protein